MATTHETIVFINEILSLNNIIVGDYNLTDVLEESKQNVSVYP